MSEIWQKNDGHWHSCHSWQDPRERMIAAMTLLLILLALAAVLSFETIRAVLHDGRGPQRAPLSHFDDPQFRAPAQG